MAYTHRLDVCRGPQEVWAVRARNLLIEIVHYLYDQKMSVSFKPFAMIMIFALQIKTRVSHHPWFCKYMYVSLKNAINNSAFSKVPSLKICLFTWLTLLPHNLYMIQASFIRMQYLIVFNILRPGQDGRHFPGDIFECSNYISVINNFIA